MSAIVINLIKKKIKKIKFLINKKCIIFIFIFIYSALGKKIMNIPSSNRKIPIKAPR